MLTVDEIEALADTLTPPMWHVVMRCSEAAWGSNGYAPRCWWDVVHGRSHCSFHGTIKALARRGIIEIRAPKGMSSMVALTMEGGRLQACGRLRGYDARSFERW